MGSIIRKVGMVEVVMDRYDIVEGRISCDRADMGYALFCQMGRENAGWVVLLDDKQVENVITADTKRGFVRAIPVDEKGNKVVDKHAGRMVVVVRHGTVRILRERRGGLGIEVKS